MSTIFYMREHLYISYNSPISIYLNMPSKALETYFFFLLFYTFSILVIFMLWALNEFVHIHEWALGRWLDSLRNSYRPARDCRIKARSGFALLRLEEVPGDGAARAKAHHHEIVPASARIRLYLYIKLMIQWLIRKLSCKTKHVNEWMYK